MPQQPDIHREFAAIYKEHSKPLLAYALQFFPLEEEATHA